MIDHSNCGIGAIVNRNAQANHEIIQQGIQLLQALDHRGGTSHDGTGDGCGMLLQLPIAYYQNISKSTKPLAVMMVALPQMNERREQAEATLAATLAQAGLAIVMVRDVPVDETILTPKAKLTQPLTRQYIVATQSDVSLYVVRRQIEQAWLAQDLLPHDASIASFSSETIVYKGLLTPSELPAYYLDLQNPAFVSTVCVVHQRFSTNTTPTWNLAQPFRYLAHNGEINTVSGNINWLNAKANVSKNPSVFPVCDEVVSDSANLDRAVELMLDQGFSLAEAMTRLVPPAYEHNHMLSEEQRAYYHYASLKNEPWDGPAGIIVCDGRQLVATLDRNGLRPFRVMTTENQIILASEIGVLNTPLNEIEKADRVRASELLCIDLNTGEVSADATLKAQLASQQPYEQWLNAVCVEVDAELPTTYASYPNYAQKFQYQKAEYDNELRSLVQKGSEEIGSFPHTAPLPQLQAQAPVLFDFLKQNFAQVTNPPLDSLREAAIFSTKVALTSVESLNDVALSQPVYQFEMPILTPNQFETIAQSESLQAHTLSLQYDQSLASAITKLEAEVSRALSTPTKLIILDDEGPGVAIPSLLATTIVHQTLLTAKRRHDVRFVIKSADARLPIHYCQLLAFGADVIYPYYAYSYLHHECGVDETGMKNYLQGCQKTLLKLMAKMGIATVNGYRGSQVFSVVGLDEKLGNYFGQATTLSGGLNIAELDDNLQACVETVAVKNEYLNIDKPELTHAYEKTFIKELKASLETQDFAKFCELMENERAKTINLRDEFTFNIEAMIAPEQVQSEASIMQQFVGAAMSYGALSIEAHTTIATAFNELGLSSNSGEGGEELSRQGTITGSKIKQVASGRFGVTYDYLRNAQEIQIKIAQGAKPGEGGHLPKEKVDATIASVRHTKMGVNLISPPPHHDIYSIEDLAQLIYDMQTVNPQAIISVKLASLFNVGTIANGVVKAGAQKLVISGFNGGTGASAKSSLKGTGLPWEFGLYQTHQTLLANHVRHTTTLQVDGQIKSGFDVIIGAILGADEFGIGTMSLIGVDCIGCKMCHTNKCPKGITTQDEKFRARFVSDPTRLKTYLQFLARHTRELLIELGVASLGELRGRTDLLLVDAMSNILLPWCRPLPEVLPVSYQQPNYNSEKLSTTNVNKIVNTQRTLGVQNLSDEHQVIKTHGYAGQSFGAFITENLTLTHTGYANDYVGKGLSGGQIHILSDETTRERLACSHAYSEHFIAGNTILYGATSGTCYLEGNVGERFAVRNSGAIALAHGLGVHACEYMTGGIVISLGEVGANIGAGMTGGLLFLYKPTNLEVKINSDVKSYHLKPHHETTLKNILEDYVHISDNPVAKNILNNFKKEAKNFTLITSKEYYKLERV